MCAGTMPVHNRKRKRPRLRGAIHRRTSWMPSSAKAEVNRRFTWRQSCGGTSHMKLAILSFVLCAAAGAQSALTIENSATATTGPVAPDSAVSAFGSGLATQTAVATELPLPTTLAGITVQVTDSANHTSAAGLIFVSPSQINFVVPANVATGTAKVAVQLNSTVVAQGTAQVQAAAPGLYAATGNGKGPAAALAVQIAAVVGPQNIFPTFTCDLPFQTCHVIPLQLGVDTPLFVALFGTGIRGAKKVTVTVGGHDVPVLYAGSELVFPGLDQVNIPILLTLRGAGLVDVVVTADGQASNPVQILIQ
ncbi:MAG: hypothetical protein C5B56_06635 [Proteobacteria bacterium]|nr:MAG: hypothetical protein C5B56_06635 [Pseudomonadota bacterium]